MGYQPHDFEDEWAGREPEQPKERPLMLWLGGGALILFLIGACLVGAYFLLQQFQERTEGDPPLILPTSTTEEPTPEVEPTSPTVIGGGDQATPTLALQPTVTARASEVPPQPTDTPRPTETPTMVPTPMIGDGQVEAIQVMAVPSIDGNLSEWGGMGSYSSAHQVFSMSDWDGSDDLTAVWRLAWDANNLYIAVSVTDDVHVQTQSGNQIFRGDSVDMQFDTDRTGDYGDGVSPDDFQITFSPGDFAGLPPSAFRFRGTEGGQMRDAAGGNNVTIAAQQTGSGYNLEAAIPWSDLNLAPTPGMVIGVALNANDNDSPGTARQEVMKSHISTRRFTNPMTWGTLLLR